MNNQSVKIERINLENIKNVCNGTIDLTAKNESLNVMGVYGQNGSGKTALVDALTMVRELILGGKLNSGEVDLLNEDKESKIKIVVVFNSNLEVSYEVRLKNKDHNVNVISECVYLKKLKKYQRKKMIFDYRPTENGISVDFCGNKDRKYNEDERVELLTAHALSEQNETSFLFSERIRKFVCDEKNKGIINSELPLILEFLVNEFAKNLFCYSNKFSGMIYAEILLPMSFQVENMYGLVPIPMDASEEISENLYETANLIFTQINQVLPNLIPGLTIKLRIEDKSKNLEGESEYRVSVDSIRNGKAIPFRKESDGIKKIVSILSTLINVYNSSNVIAIIDELDAGVFEFLLGEIVEALSDEAKGQLIFTSHNLRALEVLPYQKILFTTTNPENRYIRVTNVKKTNNLRDMYIRAIQLGGMEEEVYQETDSYEIKRSFKKAFKKKRDARDSHGK